MKRHISFPLQPSGRQYCGVVLGRTPGPAEEDNEDNEDNKDRIAPSELTQRSQVDLLVIFSLFSPSGALKEKLLKVEMARKGRTELKKQLWDELRSIQAAR